jgi:hypothetical protein
MFTSWKSFITWEKETQDTIDFKKSYVDVIGEKGDIVSGLFLSQIVYWYLPNSEGKSKLRVKKDGHFWIAKEQQEWFDEIRLTAANYRTAMKKLQDEKLIVKKVYKFAGKNKTHIRLNVPEFLGRLNKIMKDRENEIDDEMLDFEDYIQEEIDKEMPAGVPDQDEKQDDFDVEMADEPYSDIRLVESTSSELLNQQVKDCGINKSRIVESTDSYTESTQETTQENTKENLSILNTVNSLDIPQRIKDMLKTKIDRLILLTIDPFEIELLFHAYQDKMNRMEFASVLFDVLKVDKYTYGFKRYFEGSLKTFIKNKVQKTENMQQPVRTVKAPDYLKQSSYETDYSKYDFSMKKNIDVLEGPEKTTVDLGYAKFLNDYQPENLTAADKEILIANNIQINL